MIPIILAGLIAFSSSETIKGAQKDFQTVKAELGVKLGEAEAKLEELKAKAVENGSAAKTKAIAEAEATRDQLKVKIAELQDDGKSGWKKMKASIASGIDSMNTKIQKAMKD